MNPDCRSGDADFPQWQCAPVAATPEPQPEGSVPVPRNAALAVSPALLSAAVCNVAALLARIDRRARNDAAELHIAGIAPGISPETPDGGEDR